MNVRKKNILLISESVNDGTIDVDYISYLLQGKGFNVFHSQPDDFVMKQIKKKWI